MLSQRLTPRPRVWVLTWGESRSIFSLWPAIVCMSCFTYQRKKDIEQRAIKTAQDESCTIDETWLYSLMVLSVTIPPRPQDYTKMKGVANAF